ncbi:carbohydrate ABC transporter permease [Arthrobacter mobilis]|nr:sugar ABC transporter permease [Arthrobacter mobilis]
MPAGNMAAQAAAPAAGRRGQDTPRTRRRRKARAWTGWLFALPALVMYGVFVLLPLCSSLQYSLYDWDGITAAKWVGLANYVQVLTDPRLVEPILHAFIFIIFFSIIPVCGGLVIASIIKDLKSKAFGTAARILLFIPQIIPAAAAAVAWVWMYSSDGVVNQLLRGAGLGGMARAWLGDFDWALPAVGIIGTWLGIGLCTILLIAGIGKIDSSLYEAARLDGAGWFQEFRAVTLPGLRSEIGVCITITTIAALASFDAVFMSTQGGPGHSTMVPGVAIYRLAFVENNIGLASAMAIVLVLLVLLVVGPLQRLFKEK